MIKTWKERCQEHPDHQTGMVSHTMIQARMQEEIDDLRAALAQPEQEPVAWRYLDDPFGSNEYLITDDPESAKGPGWTPLYTDPPQRKPLTKEEIHEVCGLGAIDIEFVRIVERAHGIGGEV